MRRYCVYVRTFMYICDNAITSTEIAGGLSLRKKLRDMMSARILVYLNLRQQVQYRID